ncbi:hypothetical protein [Luteolibacter soli]|uniref:Uncharacterized protein n=1 Tax=Luteolibacter soli TaxID=3135280 RepID=A0ABU9B307_9BACT
MKPRTFLLLAAIAIGSSAFAEALLPEKLAEQKAYTRKMIPYRDGVLVECDSLYAPAHASYMFARFEAKELSPVNIDGIELLLDVGTGSKGRIFLGAIEPTEGELKAVILGETADAKLRPLPVPDEFHAFFATDSPSTTPRLIGTNHEAAAIVEDIIWWLEGETWKSRKLPKVPKFHDEFLTDHPYGANWFLDGNILYGGWNHGEWGGALGSIDLGAADSKWVQLSGKPLKDDAGIPENNPIQSIISPRSGELWVATGLSHMGGTWRGLYHREPSGKWHTLIHGESDRDQGELKPFVSDISGLALGRENSLYVLASETGIYRLTGKQVECLIPHQFRDYLNGIAVVPNGDIYVSTDRSGVLAFHKAGDQWHGKQIVFGKQEEEEKDNPDKKPDTDSPPAPPKSPAQEK